MAVEKPTLGTILRHLRSKENWTLKQMSERTGIAISTLSKLEHDRLTLTYDKLQSLGERLGIRMSELFAEDEDDLPATVTARRSVGRIADSIRVETPNYDYYYLCTELRRKRMIPVVTKIRARSPEEFGELVRHSGEEILYVLRGSMLVHTEFYDPVRVDAGEAIYMDSSMGHAYLAADDCDEVEVFAVMSSAEEEELMETLFTLHEERSRPALDAHQNVTSGEHKQRRSRRPNVRDPAAHRRSRSSQG